MSIPVFIVGGGPVGMTLALELAHHGVRSILCERNAAATTFPKMDLTNGRSMELFRRLGVADDLRAVGVPPSEWLDVVWATSAAGHVLHRFAYPSPACTRDLARVKNDGSATLEPPMRASQVVIEPVLKAKIDQNPLVDVRFGWMLDTFEQDDSGVNVTIAHSETGQKEIIRADFLAGCDGGGSRVRRLAGIELDGHPDLANVFMIHFRSRDHAIIAKFGIAYHLQTGFGTMIAQNGDDIFTLNVVNPTSDDAAAMLREFAGQDFDFEILFTNVWTTNLLVAQVYRSRRVFLAGDAAHQFIPTGGYGMNTGVADAADLGWKLAAFLSGWGGETLLDSYGIERKAIAIQNRAQAERHMGVRIAIAQAIMEAEAEGSLDNPEAGPRRLALGARIAELGNAENESWGIEHGYSYSFSPVIASEGAFDFDPMICQGSAAPGNRLPSLYLQDGTPLFDLLGREFTLLVIGDAEPGDVVFIATGAGLMLSVVKLDVEPVLARLRAGLLLVRPDQHVAWRGDCAPDWQTVLDRVAGRANNGKDGKHSISKMPDAVAPPALHQIHK